MNKRIVAAVGGTALAVALALAGCSSGSGGMDGYGSTPATGASAAPASGAPVSSVALKTGNTSLGTIVVDGKGMTVYIFDKDTQNAGKSSCTGACAGQWPAVETTAATPPVQGVTGTVGTINGANGAKRVTVDGWPLYTYAGDSAAGEVNGQGVGGVWWAVSPSGAKIGSMGGGDSGYSK